MHDVTDSGPAARRALHRRDKEQRQPGTRLRRSRTKDTTMSGTGDEARHGPRSRNGGGAAGTTNGKNQLTED